MGLNFLFIKSRKKKSCLQLLLLFLALLVPFLLLSIFLKLCETVILFVEVKWNKIKNILPSQVKWIKIKNILPSQVKWNKIKNNLHKICSFYSAYSLNCLVRYILYIKIQYLTHMFFLLKIHKYCWFKNFKAAV